jgi:hypothetical protein
VPLLWIVPMAINLLPFILCFQHPRWYARNWFHGAFVLSLCAACFVLFDGALGGISIQVGIYLTVLFAVCMVCHGEIARATGRSLFDRLLPRGCRRRCLRWHFCRLACAAPVHRILGIPTRIVCVGGSAVADSLSRMRLVALSEPTPEKIKPQDSVHPLPRIIIGASKPDQDCANV